MSLLPYFQSQMPEFSMMQTKWKSILDVLLSNPSLQNLILQNISLINGSNVINHRLGRKLLGWRIIRLRASANIYDTQDSNSTPALTLQLTSDADVSVDLEVF